MCDCAMLIIAAMFVIPYHLAKSQNTILLTPPPPLPPGHAKVLDPNHVKLTVSMA